LEPSHDERDFLRLGGEYRHARRSEEEAPMDRNDPPDLRGVWTRGDDPQELVLSDGSRLRLEPETLNGDDAVWQRTDGRDETSGSVSVPEAFELAGEAYSDYVAVRTRAEAEWLRTLAEWCRAEATRLEGGLAAAAG
jgi:hypothetical protein